MANRDNYFILLELSFDPIVNDVAKINEATAKKQQQWSKDMVNPIKKVKAAEYMAKLDDIKNVMLNEASRKQEADAAKKIQNEKLKELDSKLTLYSAKGDELADKDLKILLKNFSPYGFTAEMITQRFKKFAVSEEQDIGEVIDKSQANNIKNFFQQLDYKDYTLYQFLGLSASSSCETLREAAENLKKKLLAKGEKTGKDNAMQSLCGLCVVVFKEKASKKKYDNYVNLTKYGKVNDAIDEMANSNERKIQPKMKERLIDVAVSEYKISVSEASIYINNYCSLQGYTLPENKIVCGLCHTENSVGTTTCSKCGKTLIIVCPSCQALNDNASKKCVKCGFDLSKMDLAVELIDKAKKALLEKKMDEVAEFIKEAKLYWPNHPDVISVENTSKEFRNKFGAIISAISQDINDKKYYSAEIKINQAKNDGFVIGNDVIAKVSSAIKNVEEKLSEIRKAEGDKAFNPLIALTDEISDSIEVAQLIQKYPPDSVSQLSAKRNASVVTSTWSASTSSGNLEYVLVRKENTYPNNTTDGTIVYKGKELSFTDAALEKSIVYYYSLFVLRVGVSSNATKVIEPVVIVDNVSNIKSIGGDGLVTLSWNKPDTVTEVKVWKYKGDSQPTSTEDFESVSSKRLDGATITGLENGARYWLRICAFHTISGLSYPAESSLINAVPQKPAIPLEHFTVLYKDEIFQAKWEQSEWDTILFYTQNKPDYAVGVIYNLNDLLGTYKKVDMSLKSLTEAEFTLNFIGECYIIPGVINATNVILNNAAYVSSVPPVKDISYDMNAAGTELYVNFAWPKKIERTAMFYRMDTYPESPDDPLARKIECSKKQYESNEGILILNPVKGVYYTSIYTYYEGEGRRIYSEGIKTIINNEPQQDVYYSFKYKKALLSKKRTLYLTIKSSGTFMFPQFTIIGKLKSVPLKRGDGDIICSVSEETEVKEHHTFEFDVDDIRSGTKLKLFFLNDKQYKRYKVLNEGINEI